MPKLYFWLCDEQFACLQPLLPTKGSTKKCRASGQRAIQQSCPLSFPLLLSGILSTSGTAALTPGLDLAPGDSYVVDWIYRSCFLSEVLTGLGPAWRHSGYKPCHNTRPRCAL